MRNIRLLLEYDGTAYSGWQRQAARPTVQGELELALFRVTSLRPIVLVAGRTDAGVHAIGQVVSFKIDSNIPGWQFAPALNANLPDDISVHVAEDVADNFNARSDSLSKRYRYRVYNGPRRAALEHNGAWCLRRPLNIEAMREAAKPLLGENDFNSFRSVECDADHAIRRMLSIEITNQPRPPVGEYVDIVFHANAYCRHMCRVLAGSLFDVGLGKRAHTHIATVLAARDRRAAGPTAPACGLTLLEVIYPDV